MKKKVKVLVLGWHKPSGIKGEYKRKCKFCGRDVYLLDDWSDVEVEFICPYCWEKKVKNKAITILPRTLKRLKTLFRGIAG